MFFIKIITAIQATYFFTNFVRGYVLSFTHQNHRYYPFYHCNILIFSQPIYFILCLLMPLWAWWYIKKKLPTLQAIKTTQIPAQRRYIGSKARLIHLPQALKMAATTLLICAMARPQTTTIDTQNNTADGIDIALAIDVSSSMLAEDLLPNRLEAAKTAAIKFVERCPNDRIALVVFSGEAFGQVPLTSNHFLVIDAVRNLRSGMIMGGTAIGMGLGTAVAKLMNQPTKSKIIILLTDGKNNGGVVNPETAAQLAIEMGVRVYAIGVGDVTAAAIASTDIEGNVNYGSIKSDIDEDLLKKICISTNGRYFRATNTGELEEIYAEINKLEKSKLPTQKYTRTTEVFRWFALPACLLWVLAVLLPYIFLRRV
jgi:Ca-activated chloride channel family protein